MSKITDKLLNRVGRGVHSKIHDELQTVSPDHMLTVLRPTSFAKNSISSVVAPYTRELW